MMRKISGVLMILFQFFIASALAHQNSHVPTDDEIHTFLFDLFKDNAAHVHQMSRSKFKSWSEQQTPRATVVMCSDSRVQTEAFHQNAVNDLFFIRNIGNQIQSSEGSIEYGVDHLHTPILLIIGHSQCGAIKTALGDYSDLSPAIQKELDYLHLPKSKNVDAGVVENVHQQVDYALKKFKTLIESKKLVVVGVVYDFRNDFKKGHGKIILIDLNGEKDPKKIKNSVYIKGIKPIDIGVQ